MPKTATPQAKLITNKTNIHYLSNFTGSSGFMLITDKSKYLFTDSRYILRAKNTIKKGIKIIDTTRMWRNKKELQKNWQDILKKHKVTTLGVEEADLTVSRYKNFKKISPKVTLINISGELEEIRSIKTTKEIKLLEKAQEINEQVFLEVEKLIKKHSKILNRKKLSEKDVAWFMREQANKFGADEFSFDPIIGFGSNSAIVHHSPTDRILKRGDIVLIDMGMKYQGYCSDMTRMIFTKKPTKKQKEIYNLVLKAQNNAIENIKAGMTGQQADALARQIIEEAGYGEYYSHAGGHGVGLDIHETPSLSANFTEPLKKNQVITIEPGIYIPGEFGVRIEDMLLVQKTGNRNLTKTRK